MRPDAGRSYISILLLTGPLENAVSSKGTVAHNKKTHDEHGFLGTIGS
jgi:hypothetical protein